MLSRESVKPESVGEDFGDADYLWFQIRIEQATGIRLGEYKSEQMRRRMGALVQRAGYSSFALFAAAMTHDPTLLAVFLNKMTINVTELLRNPGRFEELTQFVLPQLALQAQGAPLSVWSAGCSYGAEPYTLAMLLHERAPSVPHHIVGTDIDQAILQQAAAPCFSEADMANISPARRQAHFLESASGYIPAAHLCARIRFSAHDLLKNSYPNAEYDLILCRNVVIYFTEEAKARIFRGFFQALRPGGVLFVGGTERLPNPQAIGFQPLRPFFYRKSP